ncbi:MAG: lysyl-tRNA synthetase, class II [Candidatus Peregrinibacteria bacterium Greene0416_19]|nr:MAG: lysyl-tRNA synthetase, class II [Candidatus Peregrinibacteria bacterium Greene0416_19]
MRAMDPFRLQKAQEIRSRGGIPYAASFPRTATLTEARAAKEGSEQSIAGRLMLLRDMGKVTFATLQDHTGRLQIAFKEDVIGGVRYKEVLHLLDLGDIVGVTGEHFTTQKGEPTMLVKEWILLSKALRQPPEKWHGIADQETAWRQRYLDLTSNRDTFERFQFRSLFLRKLREFYWSHEFVETETPVLVNAASGALATPFGTHHAAYDLDMFLRIAPETFLKECLVGGFDRVFEVARVFRNEGLDPSHLQDFTMVEHYAAYWDYRKNMEFTEQMLSTLLRELIGGTMIKIPNRENELVEVDFKPPWPRLSIREAILKACGIDFGVENSPKALLKAMKSTGVRLDVPVEKLGFGNLIDQLYKKVSRPALVQPTFIIEHPIELSPLARRNDQNPAITDRFQLVVGGWEVVNAYSELIDPVDQAQRFEEQAKANAGGDADAHRKDDDYVTALEYGCPPCSGWGMGVDRIVALLTQQKNLRDVVLFPLMKPLEKSPKKKESSDSSDSSVSSDSSPISSMTTLSLPLQDAEYGHLLPAAHSLLQEHAKQTKAHLVATGAAMEALAQRFGGDPSTWKVAGMLHDLDWDKLEKDAEEHCGKTLEQLLATVQAPQELLEDIRSHYAHKYGAEYPLTSMLRKSLYCVDELTGFIIAVTLVRPSKKIADVEVSSVKKKMKDKGFAAQVDREQIKKCEELLGMPLDEFIQIVLEAMKSVAVEIGL